LGRAREHAAVRSIASHLRYPEPEVRAAALRALRSLGLLPPGFPGLVLPLLADPAVGVRVQAVHTVALLSEAQAVDALWNALGDSAWQVRLAAAQSLAQVGAGAWLERAAASHPDRFARHMARAVQRGAS
jgi:HEAT repeat protein